MTFRDQRGLWRRAKSELAGARMLHSKATWTEHAAHSHFCNPSATISQLARAPAAAAAKRDGPELAPQLELRFNTCLALGLGLVWALYTVKDAAAAAVAFREQFMSSTARRRAVSLPAILP